MFIFGIVSRNLSIVFMKSTYQTNVMPIYMNIGLVFVIYECDFICKHAKNI